MSYFLKKTTPSSKGLYLQIYESFYIPGKGKRNKSYRKIGYVDELKQGGIDDPISYYQKEVDRLNESLNVTKCKQITDKSSSKYLGHFLVKAMFDLLDIDKDINNITRNFKCQYKFSDMFRTLCYSQILSPGSKYKSFQNVIPNIYGSQEYSYDQILDAINFIGTDYHKYIEVINEHISRNWKRNYSKVYFDCTNYYFEIDLENEFQRKGPSKEQRKSPLVGQALLLDSEQIPLDTEFYPGNESEKPYLRNRIEDLKSRNNVKGKIIQVADKGLNCARNIYSAVIEAKDGYIFSKSIKGTSLTDEQKEWVTKVDDGCNKWENVVDSNGNLLYKYKTVKTKINETTFKDYAEYEYKCKINQDDKKDTTFKVKEKRIVTYNPKLAAKQKKEILKEVEKISNMLNYKQVLKEELGDSAKYVTLSAKTINGEKVNIVSSIDQEKIETALKYAGYNMLITSEIDADPKDIYKTYHNLWRIEESFRILKTQLEARPVYVSSKDTILGHFAICYISLTIMRLLELKTFKDEIPASKLFEFIRQYNIVEGYGNTYTNTSTASSTYKIIKEKLGLSKLGNAYLTKNDIDLLLQTELDSEIDDV